MGQPPVACFLPPPRALRPSPVHLPTAALLTALLLALPGLAHGQANARGQRIAIAAPDTPLERLVNETLARFTLEAGADEADEERELRRAEDALLEALATEGYFDAAVRYELEPSDRAHYRAVVTLGPRTTVGSVDLEFTGALQEQRFAERAAGLRAAWGLPVGAPFRSEVWEAAKGQLLTAVQARDFAAARIASSVARVDAPDALAHLRIELDSGPAYTVGPIEVTGLVRYERDLIERFNPFRIGEPYDRAKLAEFQQRLQETPYFANVVTTLNLESPTGELAPLRVDLREAPTKRLAFGIGYQTDTGAHVESTYRQALTLGKPWPLQTGIRIDQAGGFAYADLSFPPRPNGARDAVGVLYEDTEIEALDVRRYGIGAARSQLRGPRDARHIETRLAVNFEHERRRTPLLPEVENRVLSTTYTWTRRNVDSITSPRRGNVVTLEGSVGGGRFASEHMFLRGYGRLLQYVPIGATDVLILRGELGYVSADTSDIVPSKFLFRTGGTTTIRGYNYESIGVERGGAVIGGRVLTIASVEYVKWLPQVGGGNWGAAAFVDIGDAADRFGDLDPAIGIGIGARYRTLAGPIAVDLAYGERNRNLRLHFSVAIAF
jgi:translocation and assembly module TamA